MRVIKDFIRERDRRNQEFWDAWYEARKPMDEIMKRWMDAREEANRPIREYFHEKLMEELKEFDD